MEEKNQTHQKDKKTYIFLAGISLLVALFAVIAAFQKNKSGILNKTLVFVVKGTNPVVFSHRDHCLKHKLKCGDCHYRQKIFPQAAKPLHLTMQDINNGKGCGYCHNGKLSFGTYGNCAKCHQPVDLKEKNIIVIYEK